MREAVWVDGDGRQYAVLLPDEVPDSEAYRGLPLGPPPLEALGLPHAMMVRLHQELFYRRMLTEADARRRPQDITAALMAAFKVDATTIAALYAAPPIDALPPEAPAL